MRRVPRELTRLRRAFDSAHQYGEPYLVYVGTPRLPERRPAIHVRSAFRPHLRQGEMVAYCSPTGLVRIAGAWASVVQVEQRGAGAELWRVARMRAYDGASVWDLALQSPTRKPELAP